VVVVVVVAVVGSGCDSARCNGGCDRWKFLGTFAKLRKATVNFFMSVHPSVRLSHRKEADEILYLGFFFRKSVEKTEVSLKSGKNSRYFT
jgi:hypothetical protein